MIERAWKKMRAMCDFAVMKNCTAYFFLDFCMLMRQCQKYKSARLECKKVIKIEKMITLSHTDGVIGRFNI